MKVIKVTSCRDCPHCEFYSPECRGSDRYTCNANDSILAKEEVYIVSTPVIVNAITQTVSKEIGKWVFSADGKTEWDGKIPSWCPLEDYPFDVKEWSNL